MIVAPNSPRPGVVAGFALTPPGVAQSAYFTLGASWITVSGSFSAQLGGEVSFVRGDTATGMPLSIGALASFNFRGNWAAITAYALNDVVLAADANGVIQTWAALGAFTSGATFLPPGGTSPGTQWSEGLTVGQIYYIVGISGGSISISATQGGGAITFSQAFGDALVNVIFGVGGFGTGTGLSPALSLGALFAQGLLWRPSSQPAVPPAPANAYAYLGYNSTSGLYWTANPAGDNAGDAVLGWVRTSTGDILAASMQNVPVAAAQTSGGTGNSFVGYTGVPPVLPVTSANVPTGIDPMTAVSGILTPNLGIGWTHQGTLTSVVSLATPVNVTPGATFVVVLIQDGTGGRTATWSAFYKGISEFALDTRANTYASLLFQVQTSGTSAMLLLVASNGTSTA